MIKEDGIALKHLIDALQEAINNLEKSRNESKKEEFDRAKAEILDIQKRISSLIR